MTPPRKRILVVDDEVQVAQVLAAAVEDQGHTALLAYGGEAALEVLATQAVDAVFLDVAMPGLDGVEVLRRIRRERPALPVVLITAYADDAALAEARALGVDDVIEKPAALKHLQAAVRRLGRPPA